MPTGTGPCGAYAEPASHATVIPQAAVWLSPTKLEFTPRTPDGFWPADATVTVSAPVSEFATRGGTYFSGSVDATFQTGDKRVIDVNLTTQSLNACSNGVLANHFLVSTGKRPDKMTTTGRFYIYERLINATMTSGGNPKSPDYYLVQNVPFTQYFNGGDALHGAWLHNNFGHPMSHGCVNVSSPTHNTSWPYAPQNAGWLWNFHDLGDPVVVHGVTP
jgi:lipoprotein-anchoring transpeptidase ErfK/SrfK